MRTGQVARVMGVVVDAQFAVGDLPSISSALLIKRPGLKKTSFIEVQEHVDPQHGAVRGDEHQPSGFEPRHDRSTDTGEPIHGAQWAMPRSGRVFNVLGTRPSTMASRSHRRRSSSPDPHGRHLRYKTQKSVRPRSLVTGLKVIDLLTPYGKGAKIGLFGGAGVGKTMLVIELIRQSTNDLRTRPGRVRWCGRTHP